MIDLVDVQAGKPVHTIPVSKVGVSGIKYPVHVRRNEREIDLLTKIDIFVDLPSTRKGADFSRKIEAINEIILSGKNVPSIEDLSSQIALKTLEKLPYSSNCTVLISADYLLQKENERKKPIIVNYKILGETTSVNRTDLKKYVGVEVQGMNACPCAMETTRALISKDFPGNEEILSKIPSITHNQRNVITLKLQVPDGRSVEADDLISLVEEVNGGSLYSLLKRIDEGELVYNAHRNPKFVEDIVREVASKTLERYGDFPDSTSLYVQSKSEESIHPHDALATIETTFGELRKFTES